MDKREFTETRTSLAKEFAEAGAELLSYMGTSAVRATIPQTDPPRYVVAGTPADIAKLLPDAKAGNMSLEGIPKYEWWLIDREEKGVEYVKVSDVERLFADVSIVPPLTAPAPLTTWQPISTAPMDGSEVLLYLQQPFDRVAKARWFDIWENWIEGEFPDPQDEYCGIGSRVPTHWMPLPAAPGAAPAPQQSENKCEWPTCECVLDLDNCKAAKAAPAPLTDEQILTALASITHEVPVRLPPGWLKFARAIEREVAKAAPAAPVQTAELDHSFDHLAGRGMHELRIDELPAYLAAVATNHGARSEEFTTAAQWVASELERKTNDERVIAVRLAEFRDRVAAPVQAEQAQAEPVAWMTADKRMLIFADVLKGNLDTPTDGMTPLYAGALPAQAEQVAAVRAAYERAAMVCQNMYEDGEGGAACSVAADRIRALATKKAVAQVPAGKGSSISQPIGQTERYDGNRKIGDK